jgi:hypothetical protein
LEVYGFEEAAELLEEAGYPGSEWISDSLIDGLDYNALGFAVSGLKEIDSKQLYVEMDFDFSSGRIRLEKLAVHLLNAPVPAEQVNDLNAANLAEKYQAIRIEYNDLIPIQEALAALTIKPAIQQAEFLNIKTQGMNLNNLENLKEELKALAFKDKVISEMEKNMEKGIPEFVLNDHIASARGQVDLNLHFKQSGQSEYYYFNKFEVALNQGKPLEDGQKYMVITPDGAGAGKNMTKKLENVSDAITFFKEQKGNSELAAGKDATHKTKLATMENGKVNYVAKEFQRTFKTPSVTQTFYVDKGKGFTAEQAANLIQGRAVHRDDMANVAGITYKAWVKLDMDTAKDRHQNFYTNQYHDPSYGFNLANTLEKFNIKELNDPKKKEALETSLRNGNRPMITTVKDGAEVKMFIEAVPRYSQINLFQENGKPEKREQFLKEPKPDLNQNKSKDKELSQGQGMSV